MNYQDITTEECYKLYTTRNIACECDADKKEVNFMEE